MVRAAYSSGNPAVGVGAGNTPAVIDATADVQQAVSSILISKASQLCSCTGTHVIQHSLHSGLK